MKRLAILFCAAALACCAQTSSQSGPAKVGEEVTLKVGASAAWEPNIGIRLIAVTDDSRCPVDTTCVWAGELKFSIALTQAGKTSTLEIVSSQPASIGDYRLFFVRAEPSQQSSKKIAPQDYRVTLRLEKA